MNKFYLVVLVISILFTVSLARDYDFEEFCAKIPCFPYKLKSEECGTLAVGDPLTNKCVPLCTGSCIDNYCKSCFCYGFDSNISPVTLTNNCYRVLNVKDCNIIGDCNIKYEKCPLYYVTHPYVRYECVLRCSKDSCGNGWCTLYGYCVCNLGYRPNLIDGRSCVPIAQPDDKYDNLPEFSINTTSGISDINTDATSTTNTNVTLNSSDTSISDTSTTVTNGTSPRNSDECSNDYEKSTISKKCEPKRNDSNLTILMNETLVSSLDMFRNEKDVIPDVPYKSYIAVLASLCALLLIATIVLVFVIIKMRRSVARRDNGDIQSFAPNAKFQSKVNSGGVIVDNVELYGKTC